MSWALPKLKLTERMIIVEREAKINVVSYSMSGRVSRNSTERPGILKVTQYRVEAQRLENPTLYH